ncbi:putative pyridoxine 4-dehydrogenase [Fusarium austroafricanum]|uniref:Putative pyridoxine 4-dehydrogenase n=1 Tax=Fusarium austroafricanum TaxID=2364996 RepID=A0A8H4KCN3_9HYPO|nr:putative pyridoxine 4-dehydrogenase [Fusarium austroafricanum]
MPEILGKQVGALAYGLMGFTWRPNKTPLNQALEAMRTAFNNGCTLWSGAEFYGPPDYNSMTLLKAYFEKYPEDAEKVTIAIKGAYNLEKFQLDGSPDGIRKSIDNVLNQLGGAKKLDIFAPSRRDHNVPFEQTLGVIQKEYVDTGKIGGIALSECNAETIEEAVKHVKIALVEVECSLFSPDILKNGVAATCAKHSIPIMAYAPIGRGMFTGRFADSSQFQGQGIASGFPRFQPEAFQHNLKLVEQVKAVAEKKGITPTQLAINWVRGLNGRKGMPTIIPAPGATTGARIEENAQYFPLSEEEINTLEDLANAFEVSGGRYPDGAPMET